MTLNRYYLNTPLLIYLKFKRITLFKVFRTEFRHETFMRLQRNLKTILKLKYSQCGRGPPPVEFSDRYGGRVQERGQSQPFDA